MWLRARRAAHLYDGVASIRRLASGFQAGSVKPKGYWNTKDNCESFLAYVEKEQAIEHESQWSEVTARDVRSLGGRGLLGRYGSLAAALQEVRGIRREPAIRRAGHWHSRAHCQQFLEEYAEGQGFDYREAAAWRSVTPASLCQHGGAGLLNRYGGSLHAALEDAFGGEGEWGVHQCRRKLPLGFWREAGNVQAFLETAARELRIEKPDDWRRVSRKQLGRLAGGRSFLASGLTLRAALQSVYAEEDWPFLFMPEAGQSSAATQKKARQWEVLRAMRDLFPHCTLREDMRISLEADSEASEGQGAGSRIASAFFEVDIYVEEQRLAVEYNGEHHYHEIPFFGPLEVIQRRDREKARVCAAHGIRLLTVPYWWDGKDSSLAASIHLAHPSILPDVGHKGEA